MPVKPAFFGKRTSLGLQGGDDGGGNGRWSGSFHDITLILLFVETVSKGGVN
jgi:hypothetical protein